MANFNINIGSKINLPPVIGDGSRDIELGDTLVFTREDFTSNTTPPYEDPEGDLPLNLKIISLPTDGVIKLNGTDVVINQEISFTDIDNEVLTFTTTTPEGGINAEFQFAISDEGSQIYSQ